MKKISLALLAFVFISLQVFASVYEHPVKLNALSEKIPEMGSIKCKFKQEKYVQNLDKPLISGGNFEYIKNKGVYFYTEYPVKSTTDYTNKNYKQVNDIVNAVSMKKYYKLEKDFDFFFEQTNSLWTLGMKPKKSSDAYNFISSVTINGTNYINKISLEQTNGNKTILWFTK